MITNEEIKIIVDKLYNDDDYMFDYEMELSKYPRIVDLINNMDRDEVFKGMLEEVNTWDIRSDKQECTNMMTQIIEIIDTL